jgi:hypothetical protein
MFTHCLKFITQSLNVGRDEILLSGIGVEIAIGTAMDTERNMKVKAYRFLELIIQLAA